MHRVVIVGAGFGGLSAARALVGQPVDVTIVDRRNFHTFQPLLYEVATAGLEAGDVAYPVRAIFGRSGNVTFRFGTVTGVDWEHHLVTLEDAEALPFDSVIVASGATARFFGIPGATESTFPLYTLHDARTLRDHILRRLEDADTDPEGDTNGLLTFVVVGGGPTGVEVAGALAELLDVAVRHDGFTFPRAAGRIVLVDGLDRLLTPFRPSAAAYAARTLEGRGVELKLGHMVRSVDGSCVELDDGSQIPTRTVVWAGGVSVENTVATALGQETGRTVAWWWTPTSPSPVAGTRTPSGTPLPSPGALAPSIRTRSAPSWPRWPSSRGSTPPTRSSTGWATALPSRSATATRASWPPSGVEPPSPSSPGAWWSAGPWAGWPGWASTSSISSVSATRSWC